MKLQNLAYRSALKPGQIFGFPHSNVYYTTGFLRRGAFVVIDELREVEFFTGEQFAYGDVAKHVLVEILS